jgi:hypothetical protein
VSESSNSKAWSGPQDKDPSRTGKEHSRSQVEDKTHRIKPEKNRTRALGKSKEDERHRMKARAKQEGSAQESHCKIEWEVTSWWKTRSSDERKAQQSTQALSYKISKN